MRRTGFDFDHRRTSVETPNVAKTFGFDDDDDDDDDIGNIASTATPKAPTKVGPSALKRIRADLKRFLHGPSSPASASKQSKPSADDKNKRDQSILFNSPAKNKPANVFDEPEKNKQKDIRSAFEAKSSSDRSNEPTTSNANRAVLFQDDEIVSLFN